MALNDAQNGSSIEDKIDDGQAEFDSTDWDRWANPLQYRRLPGLASSTC